MDYIESLLYKGYKSSSTQALQWPRVDLYIDGYLFSSDAIPSELEAGLMQTAIAIDQGYNPLEVQTQGVKRKKVDVIEIEYMDGSSSAPILKQVSSALYKLLSGGIGGNVIKVNKA
jgi:hypothetical protein